MVAVFVAALPITFNEPKVDWRVRLTDPSLKFPDTIDALQYSLVLMAVSVVPSAVPPEPVFVACTCKTGPVAPVVSFVIEKGR